ncbi:MAG TPA: glycosyltransferase family 4 protein [Solirubrobacteraceae bacterium]|jgi:glycosyltransferase involved in cell wall biosynthesis|nr:glycosyltransferase family 4 protein [Solirubrobacteraceae bacterium]
MPRAVVISPDPSNGSGGVERVSLLLARVLEEQGWDTTVVGPRRAPTRWQFRLGLGYPSMSLSAGRAALAERPDVIVSNGYLGGGLSQGVPRIHVYHGTMIGDTRAEAGVLPLRERIRRTASAGATEALTGRSATRLVCVSEAAAAEARRYYRAHVDNVIPNGIDTAVFAPRESGEARTRLGIPAEGRYALFVGRMDYRKGSDILLGATVSAGYELLIAGASGAHGARHLGVLGPEELADAYSASDCVVFPSRYEACSLVVLEALACGRPLLTTRVGWMRTFLRALPAYETLCVEPTLEDVRGRLLALPEMDLTGLASQARAFVLAHNSLARYGEHWRKLLEGLAIPVTPEHPR